MAASNYQFGSFTQRGTSKWYKRLVIITVVMLSAGLIGVAVLFHCSGYGKCQLGELYLTKGERYYFCRKTSSEVYNPDPSYVSTIFLDKQQFIQGIETELITQYNIAASTFQSRQWLIQPIKFDDTYVGVGKKIITDQVEFDRIYILNTKTCNILEIEYGLSYRPIDNLQKTSKDSFAFTYTVQPHYGHYYEYTLDGTLLQHYSLVDECYLLNQVSEKHFASSQEKCASNPTLRPWTTYSPIASSLAIYSSQL